MQKSRNIRCTIIEQGPSSHLKLYYVLLRNAKANVCCALAVEIGFVRCLGAGSPTGIGNIGNILDS